MDTRKKLDPRLRRLVAAQDMPGSLDLAANRGEVASTSEGAAPPQLTKRVLVECNTRTPPADFAELDWTLVAGRIYSVNVPIPLLESFAAHPAIRAVEAGRKWFPTLDSSLSETRADSVHRGTATVPGHTGTGVVVGIVDFGMDYTLADFRNPDGSTRLAFLWDQSLDARPGEAAPTDFPYGVAYDAAAINAALSLADPFQRVRHRPDAASHGTHVAGIAAGNGRSADNSFPAGRFVGAAPGATLIFVQPDSSDQDSSFTDSSNVADAVAYIFARAEELGRPCVVNMSLGQNGGSHDGESIVERAIDRLLERSGRAFVCAAGNEHTWRGHASGTLQPGGTRTLRWKVGGGMPLAGGGQTGTGIDRTSSEMEIWYSSRDRFRVAVTDPAGNLAGPVEPGDDPLFVPVNATTRIFIDSERFTIFNGDARIYIELEPASASQAVTSGVWQVRITALEAENGSFDAWIERDAREPDNNFADQSFFDGSDFDPVRTLGTPATTRRALVVANYDHRAVRPSDSSGRGPTRDRRSKPEVAAPGTEITASHALGGRPSGPGTVFPVRTRKSGTSMAAPHVAGIVALLLEDEPGLSAAQIANLLKASSDQPTAIAGFDNAWGFGRVNALRALALLRNPNQPGMAAGIV